MPRSLLLLTVCGLLTVNPFATACAAVETPNFVVINIDDLGYGDIEPYGSQKAKTPNLMRMTSEGRKLTAFYAAPVCSPSRASLMTGSYPKRALPIKHVLFPGQSMGLHPDEVTIAEVLKAKGYATGIVGKWHLGDQPEFLPTRQGFDEWYGLPYSNDMGPVADGTKSNLGAPLPKRKSNQPPLPLMRGEKVIDRVTGDDQRNLVRDYTREAVSFIKRHQNEPFFLYLPHSAVHFPFYPSERFHNSSGGELIHDWIQEVDWSVGEVLQTLRRTGLAGKTLVLFTSDNGGALHHKASNAPLRGGKGSTWEGGMRVPTVIWWPGTIAPDTSSDEMLSMMDILPSFAHLANAEVPADRVLDGKNGADVLLGTNNAKSPHAYLHYFRGARLEAVRDRRWKYRLKENALYDLNADIGEQQNIADQHPEIVERFRQEIARMEQDLGTTTFGPGCRPLGRVKNPRPLLPE